MAPDSSAAIVVVGGVPVTPFAIVGQVRIDDVLNDAPNSAALTLVAAARVGPAQTGPFDATAFDPVAFATAINPSPVLTPPPILAGMPIQIYLGAIDPAYQVFGGQIATREQYAEFDVPKHVRYDLTCVDFTRLLDARKVSKVYGEQSATAIVVDLIASFAPSITAHNVEAGLPTVAGGMTFTFEDVGTALSRLATAIGAYWYVDYAADVHFFTGTEPGTDPAPIVPGADFADFRITADLTQVRTRVLVEGDGGVLAVTLPAGDAILPLDTVAPFNPAGGQATYGAVRVAYQTAQPGGVKLNTVSNVTGGSPPPAFPAAPTVALAGAATPGALVGGVYYYRSTVELADGSRSTIGDPSAGVTIGAAGNAPPTSAAFPTPPTAGPIRAGVPSTYATTFVDPSGNETAATPGGTVLTGRSIAAPPPQNGGYLITSGGAVDVGWRWYAVSFVTASGETAASTVAVNVQTIAGLQTMNVQAFPGSTDPRVLARNIYRSTTTPTSTGGPQIPWRLVVSQAGGANQGYADVSPDSGLAPTTPPTISTADGNGEGAIVTVPTSADPRIVGRRLYRKDGTGEYRLVADIRDNVTTTFSDIQPSSGGDLAPNVNRVTTGAVNVTIAIGPAGTITRRIFRTTAGGSDYRELAAINDNTTTAYLDTTADSNLGGSPLPAQGAGAGAAPPTPIGSPTLQISSLAGVPSAGWVVVESATFLRYTGTSSSGGFFLTGIPATAVGAILAEIQAGAVVTTVPALVGASPLAPGTVGDSVQLLAQVDDVPAQTALAALDGSDGVIEYYLQDRRLSEPTARARGLAELALFKTIETRLAYTTHDPNTRSGRTVHVDLPAPTNLTGDFLIQKVTIADVSIAKNWYPLRTVDASTTRFSFDDVLARILLDNR